MARQPHELFDNRQQKADLEARNGLLQFEAIQVIADASKDGFMFTPGLLRELQRLAIQDIFVCAGRFRDGPVYLLRDPPDPNKHQPPPADQVIPLVDETCGYINTNFGRLSPIQLAAYAMWMVNWIHPFFGGNGRTARAASYLLMSVRMGFNLPGLNTIPQQIEQDSAPYYKALEKADESYKGGTVDLSEMEGLLSKLLATQLVTIYDKAAATTSL
jgi:Fic family protein